MDIMETSSETDGGNKHIVAAIDYNSKWLSAKAIPDSIVSDSGKELANAQVESLHRKYEIRHSLTAAYYPQTNGLIERTNRTIPKKLSRGIRGAKQDWDNTILLDINRVTPPGKKHLKKWIGAYTIDARN
ncbi:MAG: uncharacterized protein A8A55_2285 [Amphiamblys sp. WSBS2006]|nr:MAG: uncharacterized protein A8A55_2285 [Amphiamblys sp. WSBS2006]